MHRKLNQVLVRELLAGRRFVLIIDECQNLDDSVLETIRMLSNFETPQTKLMQIILVGQTQLEDKLLSPSLAQLRQRISILSRLEPLTWAETVWYIEHRLQVAGYAGAPLFTPEALEEIWERCDGIPRNINNLCFNTLLMGCGEGRKQIDPAIVDQVLANLEINSREPKSMVPMPVPVGLFRARSKSIQTMGQRSNLTLAPVFPYRSGSAGSHMRHRGTRYLIRAPCRVTSLSRSPSLERTISSPSLTPSILPRERLGRDNLWLPRQSPGLNSPIPPPPKVV
jgi:hypothetical protein